MFHFLKKLKNYFIGNLATDEAFRYRPIAQSLKKKADRQSTIGEIGSGDVGISPYFSKAEILGLDVYFANSRIGKLKKIIYDGHTIPFPVDYFDFLVSADCLEHVKPENRKKFIAELLRVGRKEIYLIFPSGAKAAQSDQALDLIIKKYHHSQDGYLREHLEYGLPELGTIEEYLQEAASNQHKTIEYSIKKIMNIKLRNSYIQAKFKGGLGRNIFYFLFLLLLPFSKLFNFGDCYWRLINIRIKSYER